MAGSIYSVKAEFFKNLAHPVRIRVLELLRESDQAVSEMLPEVEISAAQLSQHLAVLRRAGVVRSRRERGAVVYTVADPRIFELLEVTKGILANSLSASQDLLRDLEQLDFTNGKKPRPKRS